MELSAFEDRVRQDLENARDLLGRIEEAVRETGETPELMAASKAYARFCMAAREYIHGAQLHRPLPRRFAERLREIRDQLAPYREALRPLSGHPTPDELAVLADAAESLPQKA